MLTIEQALAQTPGGFKLVHFVGTLGLCIYSDKNGNTIHTAPRCVFAQYNGEWSPNFETVNEACAWLEKKKKWWEDK